jgi:hypothetical protein
VTSVFGLEKIFGLQLGKVDPSQDRISRWLRDFELHGSLSLLLQNERPRPHGLTVTDGAYFPLHEITCPKLTFDRQIERIVARIALTRVK